MTNLADKLDSYFPAELAGLIKSAGKLAAARGQNLYLVGGVVRDLLLGKTNLDVDLVVEGDAIVLAEDLAAEKSARITIHRQFNTAKVQWDDLNVDLATARSETYAHPGALPTVHPDTIEKDLFRRDFTINAMALRLNPEPYGELLDIYGGKADLERGLIRILHNKSFIDDATRIWRAIRYEQRLDFRIEDETLALLKRDVPRLDTVSGDRLRYELECVFTEQEPEKALRRAAGLRVLQKLHPKLEGDGWLAEIFGSAREYTSPGAPSFDLYLTLLCYRLDALQIEKFASSLRLVKQSAQALLDNLKIKSEMVSLADQKIANSRIYELLHGLSITAITANLLASDEAVARRNIEAYLSKLRYVKPALTGDDLLKLGVPQGPQIKEVLSQLLTARLDGKIKTKAEEVEWVKTQFPG